MDENLKKDLDEYITLFCEQEEVKKYFILEKQINESEEIKSLQTQIRKTQKALALSLNNEVEHARLLKVYNDLKAQFDNNPLICNYNIIKENIYNELKNLQERIKE